MDNKFISVGELTQMVKSAFIRSNVKDLNAQIVADALVKAEIDGKFGHGISRVMSYAAQAKIGKVDGNAEPIVSHTKPGVLSVDASNGFAYPAIKMLTDMLPKIAHSQGIALGGVYRSHHFGVAGHIVEKTADMGMVSLLFGNTTIILFIFLHFINLKICNRMTSLDLIFINTLPLNLEDPILA